MRIVGIALTAIATIAILLGAEPCAAADRGIALKSRTDSGKRVALVIGNDHYKTLPSLNNAGRDARDIAARLKTLDFEVVLETDAGAKDIARALARFEMSLSDAEAGLVFYAGHGIQADGKNYLIPSDAEIEFEEDLRFEGIEAVEFMESMARAGAPVNLLILDACRDNPLKRRTRSAARGLTIVQVPRFVNGAAILYSAGPGEAAQDGRPGSNGVFTGALLAALDVPGRSVEQVFKDTARRVREATGGRQTPWNNSSLTGDFYFVPPSGKGDSRLSAEVVLWQSIQASRNPIDFRTFLETFPDSPFAPFAQARLQAVGGTQTAALAPPVTPADPTPSDIREAQRLLSDLGYSPGPADGIMGSKSREALMRFQSQEGLPVNGKVSDRVLAQLRKARTQTAAIRPAPVPSPGIQTTPSVGVYFRPGKTFRDCQDCPEMVVIPAGSFMMGSPESELEWYVKQGADLGWTNQETPRHRVTLDNPIAVGKYEVTREQFAHFSEETGYNAEDRCQVLNLATGKWDWKDGATWRNPGFEQTDEHPVVCVDWKAAKAYGDWLSRKTGQAYRLPSESEWEYAARAGTETMRFWGQDWENRYGCVYANVSDEGNNLPPTFACDDGFKFTAPVGKYRANGFGIHDMLGNVWEWTEDCWIGNYRNASTDGSASTTGSCSIRVLRGGSWLDYPRSLRSACRYGGDVADRGIDLGFRVARSLAKSH